MLNRLSRYKLLALAGLAFAPIGVFAQADVPPQPEAPPAYQEAPAQQSEIDAGTLDSFVAAYTDVQSIQQEYTKQLENVEEPAKANDLQQQAQQEMQKAVVDNGLSVMQYQEIASQAGQDPELSSRIRQRLNAAN